MNTKWGILFTFHQGVKTYNQYYTASDMVGVARSLIMVKPAKGWELAHVEIKEAETQMELFDPSMWEWET